MNPNDSKLMVKLKMVFICYHFWQISGSFLSGLGNLNNTAILL